MRVLCVESNKANDRAPSLGPVGSYEENPMSAITGRLLIDLLPNGPVFIRLNANNGGGNVAPFPAGNVEIAEGHSFTHSA